MRYKGKNINDVLEMPIAEAYEFFKPIPKIAAKLKSMVDVGLGYIHLGQSAVTLSGGESQRMKLSAELSRPSTGRTLYILDEPTTGLHFEDIQVLLGVLDRLVEAGNTVIIIEHNLTDCGEPRLRHRPLPEGSVVTVFPKNSLPLKI